VNDDGPDRGSKGGEPRPQHPARGRKDLDGRVSWWPVEFVRMYGNAVVERYDDPLLAPVPGKKGNYVTLLARLQLSVP
jgi:hypothetical protein